MQVESGRSDSVASHGSLQSSEEVSAVCVASGPSRPADNDVTSFSIRRPVSHVQSIHRSCVIRSTPPSRPNNTRGGLKCLSLGTSIRPQKVFPISMKFGV